MYEKNLKNIVKVTLVLAFIGGTLLSSCEGVAIPSPIEIRPERPALQGITSWYSESDRFIKRYTANGEVFDEGALTCAIWHLPLGTRLRVTNMENGRSVIVRVNDRGPAKRLGRLIDLSKAAFQEIASLDVGLVTVSIEVIESRS